MNYLIILNSEMFSIFLDEKTLPKNKNDERKKSIMKKYLKSNGKAYIRGNLHDQLDHELNPGKGDVDELYRWIKNRGNTENMKILKKYLKDEYNNNELNEIKIKEAEKLVESNLDKKVEELKPWINKVRHKLKVNENFEKERNHRYDGEDAPWYHVCLDEAKSICLPWNIPTLENITEFLCKIFEVKSIIWIDEPFKFGEYIKFYVPNDSNCHTIKIIRAVF